MNNAHYVILLLLSCLLFPAFSWAQAAYPEADMHKEKNPGTDFVQYAAGNWLATHPLRDYEYTRSAFTVCKDSVSVRLKRIITELLVLPQRKGSASDCASILFRQYSDTAQRNNLGITPLQPYLKTVRQVSNRQQLQKVMAHLSWGGVKCNLFEWSIDSDLEKADSNIFVTNLCQLIMDHDFYGSRSDRAKAVRTAYIKYGTQLFIAAGHNADNADRCMKRVFAIEQQLAEAHVLHIWENRDYRHLIHRSTLAQLRTDYPEIDWTTLFSDGQHPLHAQTVDVRHPRSLKIACKVLRETPLEDLKWFVEFRLLWHFVPVLTQEMRREKFYLLSTLTGQKGEEESWKREVSFLSNLLDIPLGELYCQRYFTDEQRERVRLIAQNIQKAFRQRLSENTWMSAATRNAALTKLDNIVWEIGYPDTAEDYSDASVSAQVSLCDNFFQFQRHQRTRYIERRLNRPVDRHHWGFGVQAVNAFNRYSSNTIFIPAGILQPPFFDPQADEALNYGAIGVIIAHELTHGYDLQGCQFDPIGNVTNWWTRSDRRRYYRKAGRLRHYFNHQYCRGWKIDGARTLCENVADNGGLNIALQAMHLAGIHQVLNGQSAEQRFFLSYARLWAQHYREDYFWYLFRHDSHAPAESRVNGALPHIDAWYEAFNIRPSDYLYLAPNQRVTIW